MLKFRLHWLNGRTEDVVGDNLTDAFTRAGYDGGAVAALDFCEPVGEAEASQDMGVVVAQRDCVGEMDTLKALYHCAACGENCILQHDNYCRNCGRKIDWQLTEQLEVETPMCDGNCTNCDGCSSYNPDDMSEDMPCTVEEQDDSGNGC